MSRFNHLSLAKPYLYFAQYLLITLFLFALILQSGCKKSNGGDPDPDPTINERLELLSKTWRVDPKFGSVTLDGIDITSQFTAFTLTITTAFNYSTSNGSAAFDVWALSGSWSFAINADGSQNDNIIIRDDGIEIKIVSISETGLTFSFTYLTASNQQANQNDNNEGNYIFVLSP